MIIEKLEEILNDSFAKSIIELTLATERIIEGKGQGAGVFTVKYQILYIIASNGKTSPQELITELKMAKSNLAIIAKTMVKDGLITQYKEEGNRKQIYYGITMKGQEELKTKMDAINNMKSSANKEIIARLNKTVEGLKKVK